MDAARWRAQEGVAGIFGGCLMTLSPPHSRKDVLALSRVCGALTEMTIVVIFGV